MLTQEELKKILHYDANSGIFTYLISTNNRVKKDDRAGNNHNAGYEDISINYKKYLLHRLAWLYIYGELPKNQIDHIDGNKKNNCISNLRECNYSQNNQNIRMRKDNTTGYKGVVIDKRDGAFMARCHVNGKCNNLGRFKTPELASAAYQSFAKQHHGEFYNEQRA
jgi:hypothetical protein